MLPLSLPFQQEQSESTNLYQGSSFPPYCPDSWFEQSVRWSRSLKNFNPFFLVSLQKISSKSAHNLLNNGRISDWTNSMVIWITTKILILLPLQTPLIKFHHNLSITFWVMLLTDKQTKQRYWKHNLLDEDNNKFYVIKLRRSTCCKTCNR